MAGHDETNLQTDPENAPPPVPEPAQPHPHRKWRLLFIIVLVAGSALYAWNRVKSATPSESTQTKSNSRDRGSEVVPVVAARARRSSIDVFLNGLGIVTPIYTVTVKTRVDGQLMDVLYSEGQMVQKGDLLVQIDPRPYEVQLATAEAEMGKDQAALNNARVDLARYQTLWSQNAIPQQQLATQQALVTQDEATVKSDEAQIQSAKLNLTYCRITAPISGRVGLRLVDPGNIVHAADNTGLVVITQLDPISVIFTIAEDQLPAILKRMSAGRTLRVEAWDREIKNRIAVGSLATVDNEIDQTTGTLKLRAKFDNAGTKLFPSQFVNARLLVEQKGSVTVVPVAAIQRNAQSAYAYLIQRDGTVTVRPITVGTVDGDRAEIISGLAPGDAVVTDGVDKLQEGSKVSESGGGRAGQAAAENTQ
jgi:multidrug efflux system membrane fusion protein